MASHRSALTSQITLLALFCGAIDPACSSSEPTTAGASGAGGLPQGGAAGTTSAGTGGTTAQAGSASGSGGSAVGGADSGSGGSAAGGVTAGTAGASAGGGGAGGGGAAGASGEGQGGMAGGGSASGGASGSAGAGGSSSSIWACPGGVTGTPTLSGTPMRITSVPPADSFNMNNSTFGIIEGPVWTGDALYVSEMGNSSYITGSNEVKVARLLKVSPAGQVTIVAADSGTNGLALDADGTLVGAAHKDGTLKRIQLPGGTSTNLVTSFMNARFNSPNDVAIHASGSIYFSDPAANAPTPPPQSATRVYRVAPGATAAQPIPSSQAPDAFTNPNGVTLSLAGDYLYVAADVGRRYPVMTDGSLGAGQDWPAASGGDGMVIDCAGNLYVAKANMPTVTVFTPQGGTIGTINITGMQAVTNLAFGGTDHKTLYISGYGNDKGLYELPLNLPGRPY